MQVRNNHRLLLILYIFGVQTIHNNSREIIDDLKNEYIKNKKNQE